MTTFESGTSDRRATKTTIGNENSRRSKLINALEKKSSHLRPLMTTFHVPEYQSTTYEDFSGIPVDGSTSVEETSGLPAD